MSNLLGSQNCQKLTTTLANVYQLQAHLVQRKHQLSLRVERGAGSLPGPGALIALTPVARVRPVAVGLPLRRSRSRTGLPPHKNAHRHGIETWLGPSYQSALSLMKRVFMIDVLACPRCGSTMSLISVLKDPDVVEAFLVCLGISPTPMVPAQSRAPPL